MSKTARYVMYAVISIICLFAIFAGVYVEVFKSAEPENVVLIGNETPGQIETQQEVKDVFKKSFNSKLNAEEYTLSKVTKLDETKPLVYTAINLDKQVEENYKISVRIPIINIKGTVVEEYNKQTDKIVQMINNIITKTDDNYTICDVTYTSYINNKVLSVAIMIVVKEGDNTQRTYIQTYNYNLETNKNVEITDVLKSRDLDQTAVNQKIISVVKKAAEEAKSVMESGYDVFKRNLEDEMYDVKNVKTFIQGPEGELYIIYAYGNTKTTSEMDIIKI